MQSRATFPTVPAIAQPNPCVEFGRISTTRHPAHQIRTDFQPTIIQDHRNEQKQVHIKISAKQLSPKHHNANGCSDTKSAATVASKKQATATTTIHSIEKSG